MAAIAGIPLGFMIDKIGKRALIGIVAGFTLTAAHLMNSFATPCNQCFYAYIPLLLVGIGYSLYLATIWAAIPIVVLPTTLGTAFGICTGI